MGVICLTGIAMVVAQPTPILISGYVTYHNGSSVLNLNVTITVNSSGEGFMARTIPNLNYYRALTDSTHVSVGDTIKINATDGTCYNETCHNITKGDVESGGLFMHNLTLAVPIEPDLVVVNKSKSEKWLDLRNKTYNITYTVENRGGKATETNTTITIDGNVTLMDPVPALASGAKNTSTVGPFTMSGKNDTIKVCANGEGVINESNETNNCEENEFYYPGLPDLVIANKSETWVSLPNKAYNVTFTVKNIGDANATASITSIIIDGTERETVSASILEPGDNKTREVGPFTMSDKNDTIEICADKNNTIYEYDETNNCTVNELEYPPMPDLVIVEKREDWVDLRNKTYNISYMIKNAGDATANASNTSIFINGVFNISDEVPLLLPNQSYNVTLSPFTMSESSRNDTIKVCAEVINESNETNNCLENVFEYPGMPDLEIVSKREEWIEVYNTYKIIYTVKNVGDANATASTTAIIIDGAGKATDHVPELAPGANHTKTLSSFTVSDKTDTIEIEICADKAKAVYEYNETNNCLKNEFGVPDLIITSYSAYWVNPENKTYNVTYTVKNAGTGDANASRTRIRYPRSHGGHKCKYDPVGPLKLAENYTNTVGPFDWPSGEENEAIHTYIEICVDAYKEVTESNETNNSISFDFGLPDLIIEEKYEEFVSPENEAYNITFTVKNRGYNGYIEEDVDVINVSIEIDGEEVENVLLVMRLNESETNTTTIARSFELTGDTDTINISVDSGAAVTEFNETNNYLENVFGLPDLVIVNKFEEWVTDGKTYNVIYTVKNAGNSTIGETTTGIYIDGILNTTNSVPEIGPGKCRTKTVGPFTLTDNCDNINVSVDYLNELRESNETNNCLESELKAPDLVVTEIFPEWIDLRKHTYNITYTIQNVGGATANASNTSIIIDGAERETVFASALEPGKNRTIEVGSFTVSDKNDTIVVCVDKNNEVNEYNETNNCTVYELVYPEMPDLVIVNKSEKWIDLRNRTYNINYTVKNIGDAIAKASNTSIKIDGAEVANDSVPALALGENYTSIISSFTMSGKSDMINICADDPDADVVAESNEGNNCLKSAFKCPPMPDLVIIENKVEWVEVYKTCNVTYTVKNIGDAPVNTSNTSVIINGAEKATDSVPTLEPEQSYSTTVGPFNLTGAYDSIKVCADSEDAVMESNETNNCLKTEFAVPDLIITDYSASWVNSENKTYNVTYTVKNVGNGDATPSTTLISDGYTDKYGSVGALKIDESYTNTIGPFNWVPGDDHAYITIQVDAYKKVREIDETDNSNSISFIFGLPDLVIEDKKEEVVSAGNKSYTISFTVKNQGYNDYMEEDIDVINVSIKIDGKEVKKIPVKRLNRSESNTSTTGTFKVSGYTDTISICADTEDVVTEYDETNNCRNNTFGIPDLEIVDKSEEWVTEGETYNVIYTVKNAGNSTIGETTTGIYIDGNLEKTDTVPAMEPGENRTRTVGTFTLSDDGIDTIKVCVNYADKHKESNETNNCLKNELKGADPAITEILPIWTNHRKKEYIFSYTVTNIGYAGMHNLKTLSWHNNESRGERSGSSLRPGESVTITVDNSISSPEEGYLWRPFKLSEDNSDTMKACIVEGGAPDLNHSNNCLEFVFNYTGKPDLVIANKKEEWLVEGVNYTVNYTVKNIGDEPANATNMNITIDGNVTENDSVPALDPGEIYTNDLGPFNMTEEYDTIRICADSEDVLDEWYEGEDGTPDEWHADCLENVFAVVEKPDLKIVKNVATWVSEGLTYNITYTIMNIGNGNANASNTAIIIDGNVTTAVNDPVPALAPGKNYTNTIGPITMTGYGDTIGICADGEGVIAEHNEDSNCHEDKIGLSDIVLTNFSVHWFNWEEKTYSITYTVKNIGDGDANASTTRIYYPSMVTESEVISDKIDDSVRALKPGENYTDTVGPIEWPSGIETSSVIIHIIADWKPDKGGIIYKFGLPDLVVLEEETYVEFLPESNDYNLTFTVKNQGYSGYVEDVDAINVSITIDEGREIRNVPVKRLEGGSVRHPERIWEGESCSTTIGPFTLTDGADVIRICADNESAVTELNDENNCIETVASGWAVEDGGLYFCGDIATQNCRLLGNLKCPPGHGLRIGAHNIVIDGDNHTIIGDNSACPDCGEYNESIPEKTYCGILNYREEEYLYGDWYYGHGYDNVVIKNLEVKNFCNGIAIKKADNTTILNCSAYNNGNESVHFTYGITVIASNNVTIEKCSAYNNTGKLTRNYYSSGGHGINFWANSDYCEVRNSFVAHNYLSGIYASSTCNHLYVYNNTLENNGWCDDSDDFCAGVNLHWADGFQKTNSVVENNTILNTTGPGIYVAQAYTTIKDNIVRGSKNGTIIGGHGIHFNGETHTFIYNNTFCDNEDVDISNELGTGNYGDENTCDTRSNYNDEGTTRGCIYQCTGSGACVTDDGSGDAYCCGDTIMKSCTFNGSQDCRNVEERDGLITGADNIVINGDGYTLTGNSSGIGIFSNHSGVTIKNVQVKDFDTGIKVEDTSNNVIENCVVRKNYGSLTGINLSADNSSVRNNRVYNNTGPGIFVGGDYNLFENNTVLWNKNNTLLPGYGIYFDADANNNTINYNAFGDNEAMDIYNDDGPSNTGDNNTCDLTYNYWENKKYGCTYAWTKPDLVITDKSEEWVVNGSTYRVTYTIENAGAVRCRESGNSTTYLYIGIAPVPVATDSVHSLKGGENYTATFDYTAKMWGNEDSHLIRVCADGGGDVLERDEANNCEENEFYKCPVVITFDPNAACVAGDGTAFRCRDVVTKSCVFNGSMNCTDVARPGLEIGANGIVIDGAGHTIGGAKTAGACGDGYEASPAKHSGINNRYDNVKIKNLKIIDFCTGITLVGKGGRRESVIVDSCTIYDNGLGPGEGSSTHGIHMANVKGCTISNNDIHHNTGAGSSCSGGGNGIFMYKSCDNTITGNEIHDNRKGGVFMKMQCMNNKIIGNHKVYQNGQGGIILRCMMSDDNTIENNEVYNNYGDGISIGGSYNIIRGNRVTNNIAGHWEGDTSMNGGNGIGTNSNVGNNNELHGNTVCGNKGVDIDFKLASETSGDGNTCDTTENYNDNETTATGCTYPCSSLPMPDLVITEILPEWHDEGSSYNITYTVKNVGSENASASRTGIWIDGERKEPNSVGLLEPGETHTATLGPFTLSGVSDERILVCADDGGNVIESNENNNCNNSVFGLPDLVITEILPEWVDPENGIYNLKFTVKNKGYGYCSQGGDASITIDGDIAETFPIGGLEVNENYTTSTIPIGQTVSEESDTITIYADDSLSGGEYGVVLESDENNNDKEETFEAPKPDLVPTNISVPDKRTMGMPIPVTAKIENVGELNATGSFEVNLSVDGIQVDTPKSVSGLDKDGTEYVHFSWTPFASGDYTLTVFADCDDEVDESDETNNTLTIELQVGGEPPILPVLGGPRPPPGEENVSGYEPGPGEGTGEEGGGKGTKELPINESEAVSGVKKTRAGYPFGTGEMLKTVEEVAPVFLMVSVITIVVALFYSGYHKEKRAHRRNFRREKK